MKLTPQQFRDHVKEHGKTEAVNTERYYNVPENTKLYFGFDKERDCLSTHNEDTENKNELYNYDFEHELLWGDHTGDFIIEDNKTLYDGKLNDIPTESHPRITFLPTERPVEFSCSQIPNKGKTISFTKDTINGQTITQIDEEYKKNQIRNGEITAWKEAHSKLTF